MFAHNIFWQFRHQCKCLCVSIQNKRRQFIKNTKIHIRFAFVGQCSTLRSANMCAKIQIRYFQWDDQNPKINCILCESVWVFIQICGRSSRVYRCDFFCIALFLESDQFRIKSICGGFVAFCLFAIPFRLYLFLFFFQHQKWFTHFLIQRNR